MIQPVSNIPCLLGIGMFVAICDHPSEKRKTLHCPVLGINIESGLTERILNAVENEPGNLPLLEFALTLLWSKQQNGQLTHYAYEAIGGVEKALASYAQEKYDLFSESEKQQVEQIISQLVSPGEETKDTKRLATRSEIGNDNWNLVASLANLRLVVTGRDEKTGQETAEIVHEALIREWTTLKNWTVKHRIFRTWQEQLRVRIDEWKTLQKNEDLLLRGISLTTAENWMQTHSREITEIEKSFIQKSLQFCKNENRKRLRRKRLVFAGIVGITVPLFLLGQWSMFRRARSSLLETARQNLTSSAINKATGLEGSVRAVTSELLLLADSQALRTGDDNAVARALRRYTEVASHTVVCLELTEAETGTVISTTCNTSLLPQPLSLPWQKQSTGNPDSDFYLVDLYNPQQAISEDSLDVSSNDSTQAMNPSLLDLIVAAPTYNSQGKLRYTLSAQLVFTQLEDTNPRSLIGRTVIIDPNGIIVTHPNPESVGLSVDDLHGADRFVSIISLIRVGNADTLHLYNVLETGDEWLAGFSGAQLPISTGQIQSWNILAVTPIHQALHGLEEIRIILVIVTLGLTCTSVLLAKYLSSKMVQ